MDELHIFRLNTAYLENFCCTISDGIESDNIGFRNMNSLMFKPAHAKMIAGRVKIDRILSGVINETIASVAYFLYKVSPFGKDYFRHTADVSSLKAFDLYFESLAHQLSIQSFSDRAAVKDFKPEFTEIANQLCLPTVYDILQDVVRRNPVPVPPEAKL